MNVFVALIVTLSLWGCGLFSSKDHSRKQAAGGATADPKAPGDRKALAQCLATICGAEDHSYSALVDTATEAARNAALPETIEAAVEELIEFETTRFERQALVAARGLDVDFEALSDEQRTFLFLRLAFTIGSWDLKPKVQKSLFGNAPALWKLYGEVLKRSELEEISSIWTQGPTALYRSIYPDKTMPEILEIERSRYRSLMSMMALSRKVSPVSKAVLEGALSWHSDHKVLNTSDFSEAHLKKFASGIRYLSLIFLSLTDDEPMHRNISAGELEALTRAVVDSQIVEVDAQAIVGKRDELKLRARVHFAKTYQHNLRSLPSKDEIRQFKERIKSLPSKLRKDPAFLGGWHRRESYLQRAFDQMAVVYSIDRDSFAEYVAKTLTAVNRFNRRMSLLGKQNVDMATVNDILDYIDKSDFDFDEVFDFIGELKDQFTLGLTDATLPTINVIWVSWASIRAPDAGESVFRHEVGHRLHRLILDDWNAGVLSAGEKQHFQTIFNRLESLHAHENRPGHYLSEDFADYVSAGGPGNAGCFLVDRDANASTVNLNEEDVHSSSFFRILHIHHLQSQTVPAECRTFVRSKNEFLKF